MYSQPEDGLERSRRRLSRCTVSVKLLLAKMPVSACAGRRHGQPQALPHCREAVRPIAPDAGGRKVQGRPCLSLRGQRVALGRQRGRCAIAVVQKAAAGRRGFDRIDKAALLRLGQQNKRNAADDRADATVAGTISTTNRRSAGTPPSSKAREITPVPAPSSTMISSFSRAECCTTRLQSAFDEGTTEPICSGLASHRLKNISGLAGDVSSAG